MFNFQLQLNYFLMNDHELPLSEPERWIFKKNQPETGTQKVATPEHKLCSIRFPKNKEFWIINRDSSAVEHLHSAEGPRFKSWSRYPNQNSLIFGFLLTFSPS